MSADRIETSSPPGQSPNATSSERWYSGITRYQWLILAIASAGWIFDVYEGQIFNLTRGPLLRELLHAQQGDPRIAFYGDIFLGIFLLGGTAGGILFGSLADRIGRRPTLALTILLYSLAAGLTGFAQSLPQVGLLRFIVAMGVGGEWAVAASLVSETFPTRARAHASGIFHATSVIGTWAATLAGMAVGAHWRQAYLVGVAPALVVAWVMAKVREPESWVAAKSKSSLASADMGKLSDLFSERLWAGRALAGVLLAAVGLGTFWAVTVAGQDLAAEMLRQHNPGDPTNSRKAQFAYGIVQTIGGGAGLLSFGPLSARIGRKKAFSWFLVAATIIVPITCFAPRSYGQLLFILPIFGFLTLGFHAGFAIYFPELFPTRFRATGAGFCFNVGRTLAATVLFFSGWLKSHVELHTAIASMGLLFLAGLVVLRFLPETKDRALPE